MQFNPIPYLAIWSVFAVAVIVLLVMRKVVAAKEDDQLHVLNGATQEQSTVTAKLDVIDKWGKILTVIAVVFGLVIGALYVISTFNSRGGM